MRQINLVVIHCSASANTDSLFRPNKKAPARLLTPVAIIDGWHRERGFSRNLTFLARFNPQLTAIGYHYIIYRNGAVATGRHVDEIGAHAKGYNKNSLGICLIGTDQYTTEQWASLDHLIKTLKQQHPRATIVGHRDLSPDKNNDGTISAGEYTKLCPGFDVAKWLTTGDIPHESLID